MVLLGNYLSVSIELNLVGVASWHEKMFFEGDDFHLLLPVSTAIESCASNTLATSLVITGVKVADRDGN
jgi:hypothetical protein